MHLRGLEIARLAAVEGDDHLGLQIVAQPSSGSLEVIDHDAVAP